MLVGKSAQPCTRPYKRHWYDGQLGCTRCGCPNPKWKPNGEQRRRRVLVLIKPARRPKWWPQDDVGRTAWATLNCDRYGVWGYTVGRDPDRAVSPRYVWPAINEWEEDNDHRMWDVKVEIVR